MVTARKGFVRAWAVACAAACLFAVSAPSARADDDAGGLTAEEAAAIQSTFAEVRAMATGYSDGLAHEFIGSLIVADNYLDSMKITNPEHRFHLLESQIDDFIDSQLAAYDKYADEARLAWAAYDPVFRVALRRIIQFERVRLVATLREDPDIIRSIMRRLDQTGEIDTLPLRSVLAMIHEAGETADKGEGFVNRLRRAARVGDMELKRVVTARTRKLASDYTDILADQYVIFLVAANAEMDSNGITDTIARAYTLAEGNEAMVGQTMADFDRFAAETSKATQGAGQLIESAVSGALAAERARLDLFLKTDPAQMREAYTDPDGTLNSGSVTRNSMELDAEIKAEGRSRGR